MKTTVEELKELYASMGGTAQDVAGVSTIPDMLAALAEIAGTAIELPAVSSTDNGDVLTVVSGEWAKAEPSGGSSKKYINLNYSEGTGGIPSRKEWTILDSDINEMIDEVVERGAYEELVVVINGLESGKFNVRHYFSSIFVAEDHNDLCFSSVYGGVNTYNGYAAFVSLHRTVNEDWYVAWTNKMIYED